MFYVRVLLSSKEIYIAVQVPFSVNTYFLKGVNHFRS